MQIFTKKSQGFTLIELLVVIAIIGILAAIVLVSLGGARDRARTARIQADVAQVRTQAELVFTVDNSYDDLCETEAVIDPANTLNQAHGTYGTQLDTIEDDIASQQGVARTALDLECYDDPDDYCVTAALPTGGNWCIDDDGHSQLVTGACAAATTTCDTL